MFTESKGNDNAESDADVISADYDIKGFDQHTMDCDYVWRRRLYCRLVREKQKVIGCVINLNLIFRTIRAKTEEYDVIPFMVDARGRVMTQADTSEKYKNEIIDFPKRERRRKMRRSIPTSLARSEKSILWFCREAVFLRMY